MSLKDFIERLQKIEAEYPGIPLFFDYVDYDPRHREEWVRDAEFQEVYRTHDDDGHSCHVRLTNRPPDA